MTDDLTTKLRLLAMFYNFSYEQAKSHADEVWEKMQGNGPARLPVVNAAWNLCPGTYSYYDTARALEKALIRKSNEIQS
jgi:hypothetical protein